jgi:hypothetical protein
MFKTFTAAALGFMLASSAHAQTPTTAGQMEHHVAKIDGARLHYVTPAGRRAGSRGKK